MRFLHRKTKSQPVKNNIDSAAIARLEVFMQKIQEKQEVITQNYLRRDDYDKAHQSISTRVDFIERDIQRRVEEGNRQFNTFQQDLDRKIREKVVESTSRVDDIENKLDTLSKDIQDTRVRNLTWIIGLLTSAFLGGGLIQIVHAFTGK